ncbi:hypothetical protein FT663_02946 [Candidozyma haemuli var. vulneris]|nr:hypothetical protein FT662_04871 [[Candida] haemuloni var. vulneris]KAF3990980.1 hypothetical protein FT663_02946 [[Candida] haemuloni var. vulneris]
MENFSIDALIGRTGMDPIPTVLTEPYSYISSIPGNNQNMRYRFIVAFNEMFFKIQDKAVLEEIGTIISIFHDSSLLIDDIEDASEKRRGQESAHIKYGTPLTINCGNLMYFEALRRATNVLPELRKHPSVSVSELQTRTNSILVDEMLNLHHGQGLDIFWRDTLLRQWHHGEAELPSLQEYLLMVMNKTGGLFRLSVRLLALFTDDCTVEIEKLVTFSNLLGIIYQVRDDYLNLVDDRYQEMKGIRGEDLAEGKISLPILYALKEVPPGSPIHDLFFGYNSVKQRLQVPAKLEETVLYMQQATQSLKVTYKLLQEYVAKAQAFLVGEGGAEDSLLMKVITHLGEVPEV